MAVRSVVAADDVGRVIHPVLAAGQVEGGTLQAVGYATLEEMKLADGRCLQRPPGDYLIPTALDAPRIRAMPGGGALWRRAAWRQGRGRAADGRGRARRRGGSVTMRPASGSTAPATPRRILAASVRVAAG
ncbi:MAG: molybdopterin cofactor-binding domain-containing protein [Chloroflexota bacterium]